MFYLLNEENIPIKPFCMYTFSIVITRNKEMIIQLLSRLSVCYLLLFIWNESYKTWCAGRVVEGTAGGSGTSRCYSFKPRHIERTEAFS